VVKARYLRLLAGLSALAIISMHPGPPAYSQTATPTQKLASTETTAPEAALLSENELEVLVARIALYPDDLVAIILPASTNPLQIVRLWGAGVESHSLRCRPLRGHAFFAKRG